MGNLAQNSHHSANEMDGSTALMMSLTKNNKTFAEIGTFVENTLQKYKSTREQGEYSQEEMNIINWLEGQETGYESLRHGKRKFTIRQSRDKDIINEIENQDYVFLKKILDIMLKDIVQDFLSHILGARVFSTSDYDDINAGIDAIIEFTGSEGTKYLGVDFCVTQNRRYIGEKASKRFYTRPKEFSHYTGYTGDIERVVKDFNPKVISLVYTFYLNKIKKGENPSLSIKQIYKQARKIVNNNSSETIETVNSMRNTLEKILPNM